jgi:glycosyltransferase involved in cell wall biosynthesis
MKIIWSLPVRGERLTGTRGDLVRARSLIEALRDAGHEVEVVEDAATANGQSAVALYRGVIRRLLPRRAALVLRDVGRLLHGRRHARRVAELAVRSGADLLVETQVHFTDAGARAARATGLPLLLDDCSPVEEESALGCGLPFLARAAFRRQVDAARAVLVPNQSLRTRLLEDGVPEDKLRVVPNAAAVPAPHALDRARVRQTLALEDDAVVFVFAGSFQPWHAVDLLVRGLARCSIGSPAMLLLLGEGPARGDALRLARRLGVDHRVLAPGAVPPQVLPAYLAACDVGALGGSNDYGEPMKLLEYAAAGLPLLAPDLPPVRALVEQGVTGMLFSPGDAERLGGFIEQLSEHAELRARLGAEADRRARLAGGWSDRAGALLRAAFPDAASGAPRQLGTAA